METFEKGDCVLENPRRYAGEPEKKEDLKSSGQKLGKKNTHTRQMHTYMEERLM